MNILKKIIWIICGFIAFGCGVIGIVLPILPTTPFLLLSSVCFFRGSEKLDNWFKQTKVYKKHLEGFIKNKAMTKKQKWTILLFADFMMMFPLIFIGSIIGKICIVAVMIGKYYYFMVKIDTIDEKKKC